MPPLGGIRVKPWIAGAQDDLTVKYNCHAAPVESSLKISKVKKASRTQAKFLGKAFCDLRKQVPLKCVLSMAVFILWILG
jgi:hypothetical protein